MNKEQITDRIGEQNVDLLDEENAEETGVEDEDGVQFVKTLVIPGLGTAKSYFYHDPDDVASHDRFIELEWIPSHYELHTEREVKL